jgi:serine/threonine-protein kinase
MAPEELRPGGVIDERTTVFNLGRTIRHLLDGSHGWRGSARQGLVAGRATETDTALRFTSVAELFEAWKHATPTQE